MPNAGYQRSDTQANLRPNTKFAPWLLLIFFSTWVGCASGPATLEPAKVASLTLDFEDAERASLCPGEPPMRVVVTVHTADGDAIRTAALDEEGHLILNNTLDYSHFVFASEHGQIDALGYFETHPEALLEAAVYGVLVDVHLKARPELSTTTELPVDLDCIQEFNLSDTPHLSLGIVVGKDGGRLLLVREDADPPRYTVFQPSSQAPLRIRALVDRSALIVSLPERHPELLDYIWFEDARGQPFDPTLIELQRVPTAELFRNELDRGFTIE